MDVTLRQAALPDAPLLRAVGAGFGEQARPGYFERCLEEAAAGGRTVFLALAGTAAAGHVQLNWRPAYAPFRADGVPEVQDLAVAPDFRGQGIGRLLLAACERAAGEAGCRAIGLGVGLYGAYGPAHRLYASAGYAPDGAGAVYDDIPVRPFELRPLDDNLMLKLVKILKA